MLLIEEVFKSKKNEFSDPFNLRVHRGISWFKRSITLADDLDLQFITLWVSFNAIYARDLDISQDKQTLRQFLFLICNKDKDERIYNMIWEKFSQPIRLLLDNYYIYQGFWDYQNQKISQDACRSDFEEEKIKVYKALQEKDTVGILFILFNRLYTLRNQIMHGGSTYSSSLNRQQLSDSCAILSSLIPVFIYVLLENAQSLDLGKPFYPVVQVN